MRFVTFGNNSIDADKVDSVRWEWCAVCGWHYELIATMYGGNKIMLADMTWNREAWGEYDPMNNERCELGRKAMTDLLEATLAKLSRTPEVVR